MFFITGLPRSRTAWFSAFMTASGYHCLHEGINGCRTIDEYKEKVTSCSDSNTAFGFIDIPDERPILIIHRKGRHGKEFKNPEKKLVDTKGMHVDFVDLNDRMEEIFKYLTGDELDVDIFNIFKSLNIQTMLEMDMESARYLLNG